MLEYVKLCLFTLLVLCLSSTNARSQEASPKSEQALERFEPLWASIGSSAYPEALANQGVQGESLVKASVAVNGVISSPTLVETSGSGELDAFALSILPTIKLSVQKGFTPKDMLFPIYFYRDSISSIPNKKCSEFNTDYAYFVKTFPKQRGSDMNVFDMATGMLVAARALNSNMLKKLEKAKESTITACSKDPSKNFMVLFTKYATK